MYINIMIYIFTFVLGLAVGSFLNVCIYRVPLHEDIVVERSHCMNCGYQLAWYDLIPVLSWLFLKGRCRKCKSRVSVQYPLVELLNGTLWTVTVVLCGANVLSFIYCAVISCLIVLSFIDLKYYEIPFGINILITAAAVICTAIDYENLTSHIIGMLIVSVPLGLLLVISKGRAIGGGDVKLMFGAGLMLGTGGAVTALIAGCLYGSVIHIIRMKVSEAEHVLAMGPYLSAGIVTAMWFGKALTDWYLGYIFM